MISNGGTSTLGLYDFKKQLDNFGGVNYFQTWVNYLPNARVMLMNGDIVKNGTSGNLTNNPNSDMTGWVITDYLWALNAKSFGLKGDGTNEISKLTSILNLASSQNRPINLNGLTISTSYEYWWSCSDM